MTPRFAKSPVTLHCEAMQCYSVLQEGFMFCRNEIFLIEWYYLSFFSGCQD
jgi:hypothetical protein